MLLSDNIQKINGIGEKRAALFKKMGIVTVSDLIYHLPRDFEDRSQVKNICDLIHGETVGVMGRVISSPRSFRSRNGKIMTKTTVSDGTAVMKLTWFNAKYIENTLKGGEEFVFFGTASIVGGFAEMVNPITERAENRGGATGRIVPVYPLTMGLNQKNIRDAVFFVLDHLEEEPRSAIPQRVREKYELMNEWDALCQIHRPMNAEAFMLAHNTLSFEELLIMQMGITVMKETRKTYRCEPFSDVLSVREFAAALPYELTGAQRRVINEICADLKGNVPMNRLVQGDVGSGKTAVAAAALFAAVKSGFQGVMMAPTEILAKQHYKTFCAMFEKWGIKTALLVGGKSRAKTETIKMIENGKVDIVVGTHAVITGDIRFSHLGLAITDEQHRFGVRQRAALSEKGKNVPTLVMTATPIPRTLSLILYGDLDISIIDELPPGRQEVKTYAVGENMRTRVMKFLISEIKKGRQAYIVCPLVEESEALCAKAVTEYAKTLSGSYLKGVPMGVLHGKMKAKEKDAVMADFAAGKTKVLVSTTVIEVGVDVPRATVMIIENAERFGLSQLHQLRGRVRRGTYESFCIMFCDSNGETAKERMAIMQKTSDGFKIAERDLYLRGPGEFFGTAQHGLPELKIANLSQDMELLSKAHDAADEIIKNDPTLLSEENRAIYAILKKRFEEVGGKGIFN